MPRRRPRSASFSTWVTGGTRAGTRAPRAGSFLDIWTTQFARYRERIAAIPDDALDNGGEVSGRGRMTVYEFVLSAPAHTREHPESINRALAKS